MPGIHGSEVGAKRQRAGFTLVELLVVIAIIGALAGLLLPSISRARKTAKKVQCLNSLQQTAKLGMMYSDEHNGWFPQAEQKEAPAYMSLQVLVDWAGDMKPEQFTCPESQDAPATSEGEGKFTLDEDTCSYAWTRKKINNTARGTKALAADDSIRDDDAGIDENHVGGANVVFVDMSAKWVIKDELPEGGMPDGLIGNHP